MPKNNPVADKLAKRMPGLHKAALNRFYIDNAWQFFTHKIVFRCFSIPIAWFDRQLSMVRSTSLLGVLRKRARAFVLGRVATFAIMQFGS